MKKFTIIFFLFFAALAQAQSLSQGVRFYVGTGESTAYFIVDFNNGAEDPAYIWGINFDANQPINGTEMLQEIANYEPNFTFEHYSGFLERIIFNHHDSYDNEYDNFSLWTSLDGNNWNMAGWMQSPLIDGMYYSASYGFGMGVPGPYPPSIPLPALPSQAFAASDISTWIGSGSHSSILVVDFDAHATNQPSSFAFGIRYEQSITALEALAMVEDYYADFTYQVSGNYFANMQIGSNSIANEEASIYTGNDLSSWTAEPSLDDIELTNNRWLGISFGANRPYIPVEGLLQLSIQDHQTVQFQIYPNPVATTLHISTPQPVLEALVYSLSGQVIAKANTTALDVSNLPSGTYIIEVRTESARAFKKFIKQ